ncbi:hypothetical protein [Endozoicomonas sp. ONNA1]|uniref:hypothetical protein n=1 Tax=Endozoicomonas sp. ONNA1 TaxID=2828740 RepID=UPI00214731C7|nr:hypothetical protein [Endozoicomonas sp. ONNA1]
MLSLTPEAYMSEGNGGSVCLFQYEISAETEGAPTLSERRARAEWPTIRLCSRNNAKFMDRAGDAGSRDFLL